MAFNDRHKNIILSVLFIVILAATLVANATIAAPGPDTGTNVTINATSNTATVGYNTTNNITVTINTTNSTCNPCIFNINASSASVNVNGTASNNTTASVSFGTNITFTLNSTATISAFYVNVNSTDNSSENASLTGFSITPDVAYSIAVSALPLSIDADNSTNSTITANVTDQFGNLVSDETNVTFSSNISSDILYSTNNGSVSNITSNTTTNGVATIVVRGTVLGAHNITATNNSVSGYTTVNMTDNYAPIVTVITPDLSTVYWVNNNTLLSGDYLLNATITDNISGVKNATVDISEINGTFGYNIVLSDSSNYWTNGTIIVNTSNSGQVNMTIYAYDNNNTLNQSVNFSLWVDNNAPTMAMNPTTYPGSQTAVVNNSSSTIILNATITDTGGSGINITNVTANVSALNATAGTVNFTNTTGDYWTASVIVNTTNIGNLSVSVIAYDNATNVNTATLSVNVSPYITPPQPAQIRAYNATTPTLTNTNAYYYYNDTINITLVVNLAESNMNVSADMSSIGGGVVYNNSGVFVGSFYEHTLRYNATTAPVAISTIYPNVANISTGINTTSLLPFVAITNIKPTTIDSTLAGNTTDWATISDFTNVTGLIFEKFSGGNRIGRLEFNSSAAEAMNLTDPTTATALQSLSTNLNISIMSMDLNSSVGALSALNRSATLSAYNLTFFDNSPGILLNGSPIVTSGATTGGGVVSGLTWSGTTLSFNVTHWSNYSWDGEKPVPHNITSNGTNINTDVKLSVNWTDYNGTLSNYTFSTNLSGSWTNNTTMPLSGTQDWSNLTITLPSTPNTIIGWKVYVNDTVGNVNSTANQTIATTDSLAPIITIATPANATWVKNGSVILMNATITDNGVVTSATVNFTNFNALLPAAVSLTQAGNNWTNSTTVNTSNSGYYNITVLAYDNNGTSNTNTSNVTIGVDNDAPVNVSTGRNNTNIGQSTLLNVSWTDAGAGLGNYTFSTNNSGTWVNDSIEVISGAQNWTNTTITLNSTPNVVVGWRVYVNDSLGNMNDTGIQTIITTAPTPPVPTYLVNTTENFWINHTWTAGAGNVTDGYNVSVNSTWINGTANYTNGTVAAHGWRNITVYAYNNSGIGTLSSTGMTRNMQVPNNIPVQAAIENKSVVVGNTLTFTVSATDADLDTITYGTNATNVTYGILNNSTGVYTWTPGVSDAGTYSWYFNSSDAYSGVDSETINVTVISYGVNLTIPATSATTQGANATYTLNITNNGTGIDSYTIALTNSNGASTAALNITSPVTLGAGASQLFALNVTDNLSGTFAVTVTATSNNDSTKVGSITATTTVNRTIDNDVSGNISIITHITNDTIVVSAPSGNVVVTIPNSTNATTSGGAAVTSLSTDSLAVIDISLTTNLSTGEQLIGENLTLGPAGATFVPDIQVRFNYTAAQLTAAGISASELRVKFYNNTTYEWVVQTPYTLNESGMYITANVSHFSTFALIGIATTTTTTTTSGGGSGGTSGAYSVSSNEPVANIDTSQYEYIQNVIQGVALDVNFDDAKTPVTGVSFIPLIQPAREVEFRVQALKQKSVSVPVDAPGEVFSYINIMCGLRTSDELKDVKLQFVVSNEWFSENGINPSEIALYRWDNDKWNQLPTTQGNKDAKSVHYTATTPGFSHFAISTKTVADGVEQSIGDVEEDKAIKTDKTESLDEAVAQDDENEDKDEEKNGLPGFGVLAAIGGILGVAFMVHKREDYR